MLIRTSICSQPKVLYFFLILNQVFGEEIPQVPLLSLPADALRGHGTKFVHLFMCHLFFISKSDIMKKKKTPGQHYDKLKKPVDILSQDNGTHTRNPLHGNLSESPEKENKVVRDNDSNSKSKR